MSKKWLSAECKQVENKSASAKVRLQTTAELVKKDFSRFARQAQM
jgi:hypothetical protein